MRAKEFINEAEDMVNHDQLPASAVHAIPGARIWPDLDNSSPYHAFRFGVALAGNPDRKFPKDGVYGQKMVTLGYTPEDNAILDATGRSMGFSSQQMTPPGSSELPDTHTSSPVPQNSGKMRRRNNDAS
jgi:hypothetical protein